MHQLAQKIWLSRQRFKSTIVGIFLMLSLSGCSQNWGWYVVNPTTPAGQKNLKFLIDGLYYTIASLSHRNMYFNHSWLADCSTRTFNPKGTTKYQSDLRRIGPLYPTSCFDFMGLLWITASRWNFDICVLGWGFGLVDI